MKTFISRAGTQIVVTDSKIFIRLVKQSAPRASNCNGVKGGKWEEKRISSLLRYYPFDKIVADYLEQVDAKPAEFRIPKIAKA